MAYFPCNITQYPTNVLKNVAWVSIDDLYGILWIAPISGMKRVKMEKILGNENEITYPQTYFWCYDSNPTSDTDRIRSLLTYGTPYTREYSGLTTGERHSGWIGLQPCYPSGQHKYHSQCVFIEYS